MDLFYENQATGVVVTSDVLFAIDWLSDHIFSLKSVQEKIKSLFPVFQVFIVKKIITAELRQCLNRDKTLRAVYIGYNSTDKGFYSRKGLQKTV